MATPLREPAEVMALRLGDDGRIPNNPVLPLLLYHGPLATDGDLAGAFEQLLELNGWGGIWHDGVFRFPHYHSNAHEFLGIARGFVEVRFGGETGRTVTLSAGDIAVLPAGTGHQNLGSSPDLLVIGAYPPGQEDYDLLRGAPEERPAALERIRATALPAKDPIYGDSGPVITHWLGSSTSAGGSRLCSGDRSGPLDRALRFRPGASGRCRWDGVPAGARRSLQRREGRTRESGWTCAVSS
jgi:uncharacterized protein YjlB